VIAVTGKITLMMLLFFLPKTSYLTSAEILRFANIFDNAGQVFFGVMVLTPLVSGLDERGAFVVLLGSVGTLGSWFFSWWLTRKVGEL